MRTIRIIIYFISIAILGVCTSSIANQFSLNPLYRKWLPWVIGVIVLIILILIEIKGKRTSEATPTKILRVLSGLRGKNVKINNLTVEKKAGHMDIISDIKAKGDISVRNLKIK